MEAQYRILFSGKLMPGQELQEVVRRLAKKFRMREETARELILEGGGQVLKHDLNEAEAERYRAALTAVGLVIRIEPQETSAPEDAESVLRPYPMDPTKEERATMNPQPQISLSKRPEPRGGSSGRAPCPKCGADQVSEVTGVCQACGVVVERYLANRNAGATSGDEAAQNPYAPPRSDLTPPPLETAEDDLHPPRAVAIGRGWGWIQDAWELFKGQPGAWIGALLLFYLIVILLSLVPLFGSLATTILGPMLTAGLMMGAHAQYRGEDFRVSHLFAGASQKPGPLALVGLVYLLFALGIGLIIGIMFAAMVASTGIAMNGVDLDPGQMDSMQMGPTLLLPILLALLLGIPLVMAMFFAPSLVALDDVPVFQAFRLSLIACLKNILPFLVFGLIAMLMFLLGSLPLLLGLLLVMPVLTIAVYTAYRDIFYR